MDAFDLIAYADAPGTQHATIVIDTEHLVRDIDRQVRVQILEAHVVHTLAHGQVLQFAMTVRNADRTDVVSLGE